MKPQRPAVVATGGVRTSSKILPWWVARDPTQTDPVEPILTDDEHLICLRVGKRANAGDFVIPSMPAVATEAVALLSQAEPEAEQVAKLIQKDHQLAADVISLANSSLFAGVMRVANIPQAVARVGFQRTRNLVLASSVRGLIFKGAELRRAERLWRHSLGCAAIASCIAKNWRCDPNDAYLSGLFHDVGKAIALSLLEPARKKDGSRSPSSSTSFLGPPQVEPLRAEFVDHVVELYHEGLGLAVTTQWRLPEHVVDAIRKHTETGTTKFTRQQGVVALADNCCRRLGVGVIDDGRPIARRITLDALGAELEDMGVLLDGVRAVVDPA